MFNLHGFNIVASPHIGMDWKQVKFPRSKKVRIRKKWSKQNKNFAAVPSGNVYQIGRTLYMHPAIERRLRKELERRDGTGECYQLLTPTHRP